MGLRVIILGFLAFCGWAIQLIADLYPDETRAFVQYVWGAVGSVQINGPDVHYSQIGLIITAILTFLTGYSFRAWYGRRARITIGSEPVPSPEIRRPPQSEVRRPNYGQWDSENYNLWNAAHLWADLDPSFYSDHPGGPPPFYAIFSELKQCVNLGLIRAESRIYTDPAPLPPGAIPAANRHTIVSREELRRYAIHTRSERPRFLFPEWRTSSLSESQQREKIQVERLTVHFQNGLSLNNAWRDNENWTNDWNQWNRELTNIYRSISELLAVTKEINVPQALRKFAMAGVDGLSQPAIDRAMLAERLDGLRTYLESKITQ